MGVFGKSKKSKDKEPEFYLPEDGGDSSISKMSRSMKRKPKATLAPKPEFNLSNALPDTTDFRTSLLMPQLSARFSMLREQDDPTTKLGKANDDSVLFPKRASRLNLFAHNPLTDIAEVESIHTTIRAPFARGDRSYSFSEGYASDDSGSIMGRSKPGEGNNLFGGRQKMYKVPAAGESSRTLTDAPSRGSGMAKHVYEDDVSRTLYQKYRAEGREQEHRGSSSLHQYEEADAVGSPMTAFSKNRGTTSSTTSGPSNGRTSTAATSITSESPIPRQNSHGFGSRARTSDSVNGSDESLVKRFPSSESRKNFTGRDGIAQPPLPSISKSLSQSRSAVNLGDKYTRNNPFSSTAFRTVSPPPVSNAQAIAALDLGLTDPHARVASPTRRYQTSSPNDVSPIEDEGDHVYNNSLQPNDRGKATAMGLFNRPQQQFDEQQFSERQRQMAEGRASPFPTDSRIESRASPDVTTSAMRRIDAALANDRQPSAGFQPSAFNGTSPPQSKGLRSFSSPNKLDNIVTRPRNPSGASPATGTTDVKARVESLIRRQNAELAALEVERSVADDNYGVRKVADSRESLEQSSAGTFFNNFDASEDEADSNPLSNSRPHGLGKEVHPALRDGTHDFDFGEGISLTPRITYRESHASTTSNARSGHDISSRNSRKVTPSKGGDSPTLGPNGLGLSGMIHSHLRHDSDRSSIYPPSPGVSTFSHREVSMASTTHTINPPESVHSDPWEFDSASRNQRSQPESRSSDAAPTMSQKAQQILGQSERRSAGSKAQQILGQEAPNGPSETTTPRPWEDELASRHKRAESTETQREQQDLDKEFAERRRRIQERLKGVTNQELRSRSPIPTQDRSGFNAQPFHSMKAKTGMHNMGPPDRPSAQPKAMKMLGLSSRDEIPAGSPTNARGPEFDDYRPRGPPNHPNHPHYQRQMPPADPNLRNGRRTPADGRPPMDGGYSSGRRTPGEGRPPMDPGHASGRRTPADGRDTRSPYPNGSYEDFEHHQSRSATPNSGRARRDRANSAADGPRSRQGHYRDDHGYPHHNERHGQSTSPPDQRSRRAGPTPDPYDRSPSAGSGRSRNGSRPPHPGYFDNRMPPTQSPQMSLPHSVGPPRPSPRPPFPPVSPAQAPGSPSPAALGTPRLSDPAGHSPMVTSHGMSQADGQIAPNTAAPRNRDRKKSITRGMISEPTLVSFTSSVPLVDLPNGSLPARQNPITSPPIPMMNPRRRGNADDIGYGGSHSAQPSPSLPLSATLPTSDYSANAHPHPSQYAAAASQYAYSNPGYMDHGHPGRPPPRARNRLRKTSSEGGNMASRARQQALMSEIGREKENSPRVPMFPNRSATSLGMAEHDGGMF